LRKIILFIIFFIISPYAQSKDIKCSFVTVGHFYSYYSSEDLKDKLKNKLNEVNNPNIFFLGDLTHDSSKNSWSHFINLKKDLKINELNINILPGNHDMLNIKSLELFKKINNGLEKNIKIGDCNIILGNSVNAKKLNFDSDLMISGGGLSDKSINILKSLDEKNFNILLMHHSLFNFRIWAKHHNFETSDKIYKNALNQYNYWKEKIEPILIKKKVKIILSGDGHNANPTISSFNEINYISNSANHLRQSISVVTIFKNNEYDIEFIEIY